MGFPVQKEIRGEASVPLLARHYKSQPTKRKEESGERLMNAGATVEK
jgi:hypothetical protein